MRKKKGTSVTARLTIPVDFMPHWESLPSGGRSTLLTNLLAKLTEVSKTNEHLIPFIMAGVGKGDEKWTFLTF